MNNCSMFYEHDLPANIGEIAEIASRYGIDVSDTEIWNIAKKSERPPHLGNVYMNILFSKLEKVINERYPKLTTNYFVNGSMDSSFDINQQEVNSLNQFIELVMDFKFSN